MLRRRNCHLCLRDSSIQSAEGRCRGRDTPDHKGIVYLDKDTAPSSIEIWISHNGVPMTVQVAPPRCIENILIEKGRHQMGTAHSNMVESVAQT